MLFTKRKPEHPGKTMTIEVGETITPDPVAAVLSTLKRRQHRLSEIASGLSTVTKDTESEFLALGMNLQTFSSGCSKSSADAAALVSMLDGEGGFNAQTFRSLFEEAHAEVASCAAKLSDGISGMSKLAARVDDIMELRLFLQKLARSITILGTVMRIETARVGESEFSVMTTVVDGLAQEIEANNHEIALIGKEVTTRLDALKSRMAASMESFRKALAANNEQTRSILHDIDGISAQAKQTCQQIEGRVTQIAPEVGKVVAALQYHDICRQQIEHVGDAVRDIIAKTSSSAAMNETEGVAFVKWTGDALRVQISQLNHVISETAGSAEEISRHLSIIAELAGAQASDVGLLLGGGESGGNRITKISASLEILSRLLSEGKTMITDMVNAVTEVNDNIGKMSRQVLNIESISENINLLALNTIIKVARTGNAGRGLEVLADEIRKLSISANDKITKGSELITAILDQSETYKKALSEELNEKLASTDEILMRTGNSVQELLNADTTIMGTLNALLDSTKALEHDIADIVSGIRFDTVIKSRLTAIISELETVQSEIGEYAAVVPDTADNALPDLHEFASRYTMYSERKVHEAALGGEKKNGGGASSGPQEAAEADFGSNVELF